MLDIPRLGIDYLNSAAYHIAKDSDDGEKLEQDLTIIDNLRGLVGRTVLRQALTETSENQADYVKRERDVQRSLMENSTVRGML